MGFGDLFSSPTSVVVHAKAKLTQGLSGWLNATLATVQAAAPEMRKVAYSALWAEVDSSMELVPLTAAELREQVRLSLQCERVRTQKCNPATHSTFCACGGVPGDLECQVTVEKAINKACPPNRILCKDAPCLRHGGNKEVDITTFKKKNAAPLCSRCNGTGIVARSKPMQYIREIYDEQHRVFPRPSTPLHEWILYEGQEACMVSKRYNWHHKFYAGHQRCRPDDDDVDNSTWMAAAQIMYDNEALRIYFPHDQYISRVGLDGGKAAYGRWSDLPPSKYMCDQVFAWWHIRNTPGFKYPENTLVDFVKPTLGKCTIPIEKSVFSVYDWRGNIPKGDFDHFMACTDSLQSSLEEFMEVFYDCAAQFDGSLNFTLNSCERLSAVYGILGGVQIELNIPQKVKPKKFGDDPADLSDLYSALMLGQKFGSPILRGHPDQEETEDQLDHLENKQGGELISTPSFIKMLKDKKKEVRGKEFIEGSEGKLVRSSDLTLSKGDVFLSHTLMDNFLKSGIVQNWRGKDPKLTKVCVDLTNQQEVVKYPARALQQNEGGILTAQVFTVLNRPNYQKLNSLAEAGWKEAKSVCLNLHIRSYVPVHTPLYVFCVIMWGHSSDAETAALCGAGCYLGDQEAAVLQLPLVCGYLGNSLEDFEAYKRSLVLSSVFFGKAGLSAGQNVFGITAIEFTEYMPTSYGGITHERDSWQNLLRKHQGKDKGRFIAGFNVVDALEKEKEVPIKMPSFDLEPVPRTQPVVRTFTGKGMQPSLSKASSMRVGNFAAFRASNIPIGRHVDNTEGAIKYELGKASTSNVQEPSLGQPRMCASDDVQKFCFIQNILLPTSVTQGTILGSIDILARMRGTNSISNAHWLSQGYVDTDIRIVSHLASNSFTGLALWFILDAWQALPDGIGTTFDANLIRLLPCHTQILGDMQSSTYVLNFRKLLGQTLHFGGDGFATPILYVVAATTSTLPWSTSGSFAVEGFSTGERFSPGLASDFELEYPIPTSSLEDLDLVLLPKSQALGGITNMVIPLNLATKTSNTTRFAYPHAAGLLSHFLGIGGDMRFRIDILSSAFVTATLRVALWHEEVSSAEMAMIPHVTTTSGVEVNLKIQTPFYSTSNFGDSGAKIIIEFLSSPLAPSAVQSAFEYQIHILGIKADVKLCKQINYSQRFGWFMITSNSRVPTNFAISLPARRVNMTHTQGTLTNLLNSFAIMCATTGMHWGKVIIHFQWSLTHSTPLAELRGHVTISTGMGEKDIHRGQLNEYNMLDTSAAIPFEFCSFAGPTPSRQINDEGDNWIIFSTPAWSNITNLFVSIEVLPGFRFYGRRAGPYAAV